MESKNYEGVDDTIKNVFKLILKNSNNKKLSYFDNKSLKDIFDFISKDVRYITDPLDVKYLEGGNIELLRSPQTTMTELLGDCDDKAILFGSLLNRFNIPFRLAVMSNKQNKKYHHIYPEALINNKWKTLDATYNNNKIFEEKPFTAKQVYEFNNNAINKIKIL